MFNKLFVYTGCEEVPKHNEVIYTGVKLHKIFPGDFAPGSEELSACVNTVYNRVYLFTPTRTSEAVSVQEWIDSDGLCRTDSVSHMMNAYMHSH